MAQAPNWLSDRMPPSTRCSASAPPDAWSNRMGVLYQLSESATSSRSRKNRTLKGRLNSALASCLRLCDSSRFKHTWSSYVRATSVSPSRLVHTNLSNGSLSSKATVPEELTLCSALTSNTYIVLFPLLSPPSSTREPHIAISTNGVILLLMERRCTSSHSSSLLRRSETSCQLSVATLTTSSSVSVCSSYATLRTSPITTGSRSESSPVSNERARSPPLRHASSSVSFEIAHRPDTDRNSFGVRVRFFLGMSFTNCTREMFAVARVTSVSPVAPAYPRQTNKHCYAMLLCSQMHLN